MPRTALSSVKCEEEIHLLCNIDFYEVAEKVGMN